jgi:hypothetical protein
MAEEEETIPVQTEEPTENDQPSQLDQLNEEDEGENEDAEEAEEEEQEEEEQADDNAPEDEEGNYLAGLKQGSDRVLYLDCWNAHSKQSLRKQTPQACN